MTSYNRAFLSLLGTYQSVGEYAVYPDEDEPSLVSETFDLYRKEPPYLDIGGERLYEERRSVSMPRSRSISPMNSLSMS